MEKRKGKEMCDKIKKVNSVLRVVFIGFIAIYGIVKIFDVVPKKKKQQPASAEKRTSEFDELW